MLIEAKARDLGGFTVGRVLPSLARRAVGPFVFFDQIGPTVLPAGGGVDVRPHPHIGLCTVTYLFEGALLHRDTLGSSQIIQPGDINWMTAGRGIAHSERTPAPLRQAAMPVHGLQLWVALPREHEEVAPSFEHHPAATLPGLDADGVAVKLLAGSAFGLRAPVGALSALFYLEARLPAGGVLPWPADYAERACHVIEGEVSCAGERVAAGQMWVTPAGDAAALRAERAARVVLLGGASLDGPRHLWWNFVSSSQERLEQAKADWQRGAFGLIPGDDQERIPLPT